MTALRKFCQMRETASGGAVGYYTALVTHALILFLKETVRLGRIPFDYTEEDLEEARRWERIVNDDVQDTGGEETCMVN